MSGDLFRHVFIGFYIGEVGLILFQHFSSLLKFFFIILTFIGNEAAAFPDEREAPARKLFKICDRPGNADIKSFVVFRLSGYLFRTGMNCFQIIYIQCLGELVNNSEPLESGVEKCKFFFRTYYCKQSARESCTCPHIYYRLRFFVLRQINYRKRIEYVLYQSFVTVSYSSEIYMLISDQNKIKVGEEGGRLLPAKFRL